MGIAIQQTLLVVAQSASDPLAPFPDSSRSTSSLWIAGIMLVAGAAILAAVFLFFRRSGASGPGRVSLRRAWAGLRGLLTGGADRHRATPMDHADLAPAVLAADQSYRRLFDLKRDVEELAQRLAIEMDARAARLEELIAKSEDRISRLERLSPTTAAAAGWGAPSPVSPPPPPRVEVVPRGVPTTLGAGVSAGAARSTSGSAAESPVAGALSTRPAMAPGTPGLDGLSAQIYRLADEGMSAVEIAQRLGQPTGKVELIVALRR